MYYFIDVPASGLYFLTYQYLTTALSKPNEPPSMPVTILAGGMSGIANWLVGMPADVLKSRLQTGNLPSTIKKYNIFVLNIIYTVFLF